MSERLTTIELATEAAEALEENWSIGEASRFCDDAPDWDSAGTDEIAAVLLPFMERAARAQAASGLTNDERFRIERSLRDGTYTPWQRETFTKLLSAHDSLTAENAKLKEQLAALQKYDDELTRCEKALEHWPLASGCNGHLQVAGHIDRILAVLAAKERECEAAETAYKQTDAENERLNIELAKVQVEIAAKERECGELVDLIRRCQQLFPVEQPERGPLPGWVQNVKERVRHALNIAPAAEGGGE